MSTENMLSGQAAAAVTCLLGGCLGNGVIVEGLARYGVDIYVYVLIEAGLLITIFHFPFDVETLFDPVNV